MVSLDSIKAVVGIHTFFVFFLCFLFLSIVSSVVSFCESPDNSGKAIGTRKIFSMAKEPPVLLFSVSVSAQGNNYASDMTASIQPSSSTFRCLSHSHSFFSDLTSLDVKKDEPEPGDQDSPRAILENGTRSSESETNSPKASTSRSDTCLNRGDSTHWRGFLRLFRQGSMKMLWALPPLTVPKIPKRNRSARENSTCKKLIPPIDPESICFKPSWKNFSLAELTAITNNFSSENVIGRGGYGEVYKGQLPDGQYVAVKRLSRGTMEERTSDFLSEIGIIVHINHPNAAKLIGFGVEGGMFLVLRLSPHGSLACLLTGSKEKLTWSVRYKIALGIAEGLRYFHERCQRRIIHRDIKSANVLLTEDFEPQICDFGLAKWLPEQWSHHTISKLEGTFGYLAPEYLLLGVVDEKTDVYAFGVLLLELITGRLGLDRSNQSLLIWAKPMLDKNDIEQLVDPSLVDAFDYEEMNHLVLAASKCVEKSSLFRPQMNQVLQILKGEDDFMSGQPMCMQRTLSEELLDAEEYYSTRCVNDLHRHRQLALEF
ncbi:receptor-like cytosolic serine/threonine-protein kinase RBK2 [Aristolochia californica]|uniref:receptor-like cytosolic serine/threonine-protein kinase RBK2 n=1 Tax=Aristolochia californica TaxID=171875 RepID=UPI0035D7E120